MPLGGGGGDDGGAAVREAQRQARIDAGKQQIDQQFSGFDDKFYKEAGDRYTRFAMPKMMRDYQLTRNNLTYSLARAGLLKSGASVTKNNALQSQLSENESTIANNAADQSNKLRTTVADQKGNLVNQLEASADPAAIAAQTAASTAGLRAPTVIQPLGNLFADWSQQYLNTQSQGGGGPGSLSMWQQLGNQGGGQANPTSGASYYVGGNG